MSDVKNVPEEVVTWTGGDGRAYTYGKALKRNCASRLCGKPFDWDGNDYKTHCVNCYLKLAKKCTKCGVNNIKIGAPVYQKVCTACFVAVKALSYKTCPTCPPSRANHLRCPLDKDQCKECELRLAPVDPVVMAEELS